MLRIPLVCSCTACQESFIMDFRMAFLGEFWKDEAQIRWSCGDTPNWSDAGDFKASISLVWRQFQLEQNEVTSRWLGAACLVNFHDCLIVFREKISQNDPSHSSKRPKQHNTVDTLFDFSLNFWLSDFVAKQITTVVEYLLQIDINSTNRGCHTPHHPSH